MILDQPISMTVDMACRLTGLTRNQMYEAIRSGAIQTAYVGKRRLVLRKSLEQYIEERKTGIKAGDSDRAKRLRAKRTAKGAA